MLQSGEHEGTLIAHPVRPRGKQQKLQFIASMFVADSKEHGIIRRAPQTLADLCEFVQSEGFDLLAELRSRVRDWKEDGCLEASLIIVVAFPLRRGEQSSIEVTDVWAFVTTETVFEVGKKIGVWDKFKGVVGVLMAPDETRSGQDITIDVVRPHFSFSRREAARSNGSIPVEVKTLAIGTGALGSQVALNLVRGGFGHWSVIDEDILLPHNLARHALFADAVGWPKAEAMGATIASFFEDEEPGDSIVVNVLRPGEKKEKVDAALAAAELVLDFSASVPVARMLARDVRYGARRMSLFLSPRGLDLVCLSEDATRTIPLDCLETQYYRALIRDPGLSGHLAVNESRTRYARTCRDVSLSLPSHLVALHGAIGSQAVREAWDSPTRLPEYGEAMPEPALSRSLTFHFLRFSEPRLVNGRS